MGKLRFLVKCGVLCKVTRANCWLLPEMEEIFDKIEGSTVITTLDLFLKILVKKNGRKLQGYDNVRNMFRNISG